MSTIPLFVPQIVTTRRIVPNAFPLLDPSAYRIAIVGEAPGEDEETHSTPFVGASGKFLNMILSDVGLDRHRLFVGNVCQVRPPGNKIKAFAWNGEEIQNGLKQLATDLGNFNPHLCVLLGNTPLHAALNNFKAKINDWRGSLILGRENTIFAGKKCLPALHPAGILRDPTGPGRTLLEFDLRRALTEGHSPNLILPHRDLITNLSANELVYIMESWPAGLRCSLDIEGGLPEWMVNKARLKNKKSRGDSHLKFGWPCVSLSSRPSRSVTIVWNRFTERDHITVLRTFARLMYRTEVPKALQNQLYDNFVLSFGYNIPIRNVVEDLMIKSWAIYAELPRALKTQASIWTREPFWKDDSMYAGNPDGLYVGCARDSAVTIEICEAQDGVLKGKPYNHYRRMIDMQNPFLYMQLRGIKYHTANVEKKLSETQAEMAPVRERLAAVAGYDLCGKTSISSQKLIRCLYAEKGYEPQYKREEGQKTQTLTSDIEALLNLKRRHPADTFLDDILLYRHFESVRETLQITADADGRVRCGYSLEAETGRVKCYTSPTGSGANLQTIQKSLRTNYSADLGYDLCQCDLEGADGWTVAAHAARLGDPTMLEDYLAGMKPAKIIALLYWFGPEINSFSRPDLKWLHDHIFPIVKRLAGAWLYLGCKRVQHGSSYLMGIPTMILNVLRDSHKESGQAVYMPFSEARQLQESGMFLRYPGVRTWHSWIESKIRADGMLESASGQCRLFMGRRHGSDIKDTVKSALSHEPQANTTWATDLVMLRLWEDPENRLGGVVLKEAYDTWIATLNRQPGALIIEPLHQVHDALLTQWPSRCRLWAQQKTKTWFDNELEIAGMKIKIPFDGGYGPNWGDLPNKL